MDNRLIAETDGPGLLEDLLALQMSLRKMLAHPHFGSNKEESLRYDQSVALHNAIKDELVHRLKLYDGKL